MGYQQELKESSLLDAWNKSWLANFTKYHTGLDPRIGKTTVIDGVEHLNKDVIYNELDFSKPNILGQSLLGKYKDTSTETDDKSVPYFYELENVHTGEIKYGLAPNGVDERYAGQDMSAWKVNYNKRRTDAVDLEALIHGNRKLNKRAMVDYGFAGKSTFGKGATEIYSSGIDKAYDYLDDHQQRIANKVMRSGIGKFKDESDLKADELFISKSKNVLNAFGIDTSKMSKDEVSQRMLEELSGYNWNLTDLGFIAAKMQGKEKSIAKDFTDLVRAYDETDADLNQILRGAKEIITDPINLIPGLGLVGGQIAKLGLKQAIGQGIKYGAIEGAGYMAAESALKQSIDVKAGSKFSGKKLLTDTTIGAVTGGALGGLITGAVKHFSKDLKVKEKRKFKSDVKKEIEKKIEDGEKVNEDVVNEVARKVAERNEVESVIREYKPDLSAKEVIEIAEKIEEEIIPQVSRAAVPEEVALEYKPEGGLVTQPKEDKETDRISKIEARVEELIKQKI